MKQLILALALLVPSVASAASSLTELDWLARNIFFEARNAKHTYQMVTVGQVVMNRMKEDTYWGDSIEDVVTYKCEFSWYCDGKSDDPQAYARYNRNEYEAMIAAYVLASTIMRNELPDLTQGALYYHASDLERVPGFFSTVEFLFDDGLHKFFK